jgi:Tol biopolymer transport system component
VHRPFRSGSTLLVCLLAAAVAAGVVLAREPAPGRSGQVTPAGDGTEVHLANVRQLTFGGENAEAYFSHEGTEIIFQSTREGVPCDQIFRMNLDGSNQTMVSTGKGRTTCGYFYPGGDSIIYASTHLGGEECPPPPSFRMGYVWAIYDTFDIFRAAPDGSGVTRLTDAPGYDAEPTIGPDGRVVFTSVRDGDMEIYSMNGDGSDVRRLTHRQGPDGGAFFSPDGSKIIFRGREIPDGPEYDDFKRLLDQGLWRPTAVEVFVMDADGGNVRQVTDFGGASFAPYWHPDGERIIFSSNMHNPDGRNFDLFLINLDGTGLEQITFTDVFDGFPMFSPDGTRLIFASNRNAAQEGDTNVFIADWVD